MIDTSPHRMTTPVRPDTSYEIRLTATVRGAARVVQGELSFQDTQGCPLDPRLAPQVPPVPGLDPVEIAALPQDTLEAALTSLFLITPPDAARMTLTFAEDVTLTHGKAQELALNWVNHPRKVEQHLTALGKAWHKAMIGYLTKPEVDRLAGLPLQQGRAIIQQFVQAGDWRPVLERLDAPEEQSAFYARAARRRSDCATDLSVGFIGSPRLFDLLSVMARPVWLREALFVDQIAHLELDLIVIETVAESHLCEWAQAFRTLSASLGEKAQALFAAARVADLPVHACVTAPTAALDSWRPLCDAADRVITVGLGKTSSRAASHTMSRNIDTVALTPATLTQRPADLMLVPMAAEIFAFPNFAQLLARNTLYDTLFTDAHYDIGTRSLVPRLEPLYPRTAPNLDHRQQAYLMRHATLVLLSGCNLRGPAALRDLVLDSIASGAIPAIYGDPKIEDPLVGAVDRVMSEHDLFNLQRRCRNPWWRERQWRKLYRLLHAHGVQTAADRDALLGQDPFPVGHATPLVSVLLISNRPHRLKSALDSFRAQTWTNTELILILNRDALPEDLPALHYNESLHLVPASDSIGQALNLAIAAAKGRYWAKMDDDDIYSPHYLAELVQFFEATQADSVSRAPGLFYFEGEDETRMHSTVTCRALSREDRMVFAPGAALSGRQNAGLPAFSNRQRNSADALWFRHVIESGAQVFCYDFTSLTIFRSMDESQHTWRMSARAGVMKQLRTLTRGNAAARLDSDS